MTDSYNVVFEYTNQVSGYAGIITWSSFKDKAHFDEWYSDDIKARERVIAQGITVHRAIELSKTTPLEARLEASREDARDHTTGKLDFGLLRLGLKTLEISVSDFALPIRNQK